MSNPTTPFGWQMPTNTDLVTDLPADFEVFGQAVATSLADLLGGTSGQVLAKNSNTDMDFVWTDANPGDITGITATSPLTGGGTSGAVTVGIQASSTTQSGAVQLTDSTSSTSTTTAATPNSVKTSFDLANAAIPKSTVTTAGDVIYATGSSAVTRLGIGSTGQVLTVAGGIPSWATPAGSAFVGCSLYRTADQTISNNTATAALWDAEFYDTDNMHSTSLNTSRITIPTGKGGKYLLTNSILWSNNGTGAREQTILKNGSQLGWDEIMPVNSSASYTATSGARVVDLVAGDYIELFVKQNTGISLGMLGGATASVFQVSKIG